MGAGSGTGQCVTKALGIKGSAHRVEGEMQALLVGFRAQVFNHLFQGKQGYSGMPSSKMGKKMGQGLGFKCQRTSEHQMATRSNMPFRLHCSAKSKASC